MSSQSEGNTCARPRGLSCPVVRCTFFPILALLFPNRTSPQDDHSSSRTPRASLPAGLLRSTRERDCGEAAIWQAKTGIAGSSGGAEAQHEAGDDITVHRARTERVARLGKVGLVAPGDLYSTQRASPCLIIEARVLPCVGSLPSSAVLVEHSLRLLPRRRSLCRPSECAATAVFPRYHPREVRTTAVDPSASRHPHTD